MPPRQRREPEEPLPKLKMAKTPMGREQQMIALADKLAEKQLREGTASAQVISHYLKLGSSRERLEQERLRYENELTQAKIENMASANRIEDLMAKAIDAFRSYSGDSTMETYEDFPEDPDVF